MITTERKRKANSKKRHLNMLIKECKVWFRQWSLWEAKAKAPWQIAFVVFLWKRRERSKVRPRTQKRTKGIQFTDKTDREQFSFFFGVWDFVQGGELKWWSIFNFHNNSRGFSSRSNTPAHPSFIINTKANLLNCFYLHSLPVVIFPLRQSIEAKTYSNRARPQKPPETST